MKKIISKVLIIIGILIILGSLVLNFYSKDKEKRALNNFENKIVNEETFKVITPGDEIGIIEIESIGLKNVIVQSIDEKYLKYHVCHFEESAMPGENGNFALAGHSSYIYNQVFNNLHKVKIGEKILIKNIKESYIYTITEMNIVKAQDTHVLDQDMTKKEITIVTCTNGGKERLIVKGEIK